MPLTPPGATRALLPVNCSWCGAARCVPRVGRQVGRRLCGWRDGYCWCGMVSSCVVRNRRSSNCPSCRHSRGDRGGYGARTVNGRWRLCGEMSSTLADVRAFGEVAQWWHRRGQHGLIGASHELSSGCPCCFPGRAYSGGVGGCCDRCSVLGFDGSDLGAGSLPNMRQLGE